MKANYKKYILDFKRPSGTSRGVLKQKETWFLILEENGKFGIGECGILRGLSFDDLPIYEEKLKWTCDHIQLGEDKLWESLKQFPSIQFGLEQAFRSLNSYDPFVLFPSNFVENEHPIAINGLIWMGDETFMHEQIETKLKEGFQCIKMKIGAIDFERELKILKSIRNSYSKEQIELRVDANGAFSPKAAIQKLEILASLDIHSIEQPIRQGNRAAMQSLCLNTPLPIALDEELIGVLEFNEKRELLERIKPQYIILKPSLIGGFKGSQEWITLAESLGINWWVTSALESNVGLNAIAQWTFTLKNTLPQGLGTGGLYTNNLDSPLKVAEGNLYYSGKSGWKANLIQNLCT